MTRDIRNARIVVGDTFDCRIVVERYADVLVHEAANVHIRVPAGARLHVERRDRAQLTVDLEAGSVVEFPDDRGALGAFNVPEGMRLVRDPRSGRHAWVVRR